MIDTVLPGKGKLIVLTAPLTEIIDHAGYFIQMALASMPKRMEAAIDQKYPKWRKVERNPDGSARSMPAGVRLLEASLLREFPAEDVGCCYPDDLSQFIGPRTRVVGVSTHNPLGVTFAAGVYASVFGSSREPINAHYAKQLFRALRENPYRSTFQVIVGGSGGWQISQTDSYHDLGVDSYRVANDERTVVASAGELAVIGATGAKPAPRYRVTLLDTDGTVAHLELTPLRDPYHNRLRELWVDSQTAYLQAAIVEGVGNRPPFDRTRWHVTFSRHEGATYVTDVAPVEPLKIGSSTPQVTIAFENLSLLSHSPLKTSFGIESPVQYLRDP